EKIREATTEADVMHMAESIKKARFTMDDMLAQFEQIQKMGPLEKVMEMLPGEISSKVKDLPPEALDARRLLRMKAIIQSMTKAERSDPAIIKGSRRRRIAQGSGTTVQMVNQLIKQHAQMAELMKRMGRLGKKRGLMSSLGGMFRR
ncbi:MAG: signal recognition particle protein, partial [Pyramidobacter sp.]|nr:signal recognition particle protein [Pyramidobacter sp.]